MDESSPPDVVLLGRRCMKYTELINIRPAAGNRGMEVQDPAVRARIRDLTFQLVGEGEPL